MLVNKHIPASGSVAVVTWRDKNIFAHIKCSPCDRSWRPTVEVKVTALILHLGAGWSWAGNSTPRPLYPRERDLLHIVQDAGWTPGPVWTGVENLASTGIRSLGLPTRRKLLYGIRYPFSHPLGFLSLSRNLDFL